VRLALCAAGKWSLPQVFERRLGGPAPSGRRRPGGARSGRRAGDHCGLARGGLLTGQEKWDKWAFVRAILGGVVYGGILAFQDDYSSCSPRAATSARRAERCAARRRG
jgi:hypothetical protein